MKKNTQIVAAVVIILAGLAGYFYWSQSAPEPAVQVQAPPAPLPPPPVIRRVIEAPAELPPMQLPALNDSDKFMFDALAGLVGNESLMKLFRVDRLIRNIVVTVDNLPGRRLPMRMLPVNPPSGSFITAGMDENFEISTKNAARYTPYVKLMDAVDSQQVVGIYVLLYPLFQQAYEELGYPGKYFNDRLIVVLDNLLAAPEIQEPVKLVQPKVFFEYADPDLEGRSIGQRILMRIGSKNEAVVKGKLREIKQGLLLHMHERKLERAG